MRTFAKVTISLLLLVTASFSSLASSIPNDDDRYVYSAKVIRVIDGDTLVADIDLGFNTWRREEKLRLNRIDAPEIRGRNKSKTCSRLDKYPGSIAGCTSLAFLKEKVEGRSLLIRTVKNRKGKENKGGFGRYLVEIFVDGNNINDTMLELNLAEIYKRGRKRRKRKNRSVKVNAQKPGYEHLRR